VGEKKKGKKKGATVTGSSGAPEKKNEKNPSHAQPSERKAPPHREWEGKNQRPVLIKSPNVSVLWFTEKGKPVCGYEPHDGGEGGGP